MKSRAGLVRLVTLVVGVGSLAATGGSVGCLTRDVATDAPLVKTEFGTESSSSTVDKVDLLFMIDNSTSMGDKQTLLSQAVPLLVQRLVTPNCVDAANKSYGPSTSTGSCPKGGKPEFPPVHDLHVGIVSSSIGDFGASGSGLGGPCPAAASMVTDGGAPTPELRSQNDHAHLLNRSPTGLGAPTDPPAVTTLAAPDNYLAWYPATSANTAAAPAHAVTDQAAFENDFRALVGGVHQFGCGLEGQLESWYQFLVQPDPWVSIGIDANNHAQRIGVDTTTLQQRHDFLRPDSLVAVIGLSDEDDSTVDPGALDSQSWRYETLATAWKPTSSCATNPNDPSCTTCLIDPNGDGCGGTQALLAKDDDNLNVRFVQMKQRFGFDPQYPISRYKSGLQDAQVPDRRGELHDAKYVYAPKANCTNPLFATALPDGKGLSSTIATAPTTADLDALCTLPTGTQARSKDLVFFGFIGGVPWQLLTEDPSTATESNDVAFKETLSDDDWTKIIGKSPETYDYSGQDPHMVQSQKPRKGIPGPSDPATDPYVGRDWDTSTSPAQADLEFACTFTLPTPTDCSAGAITRDTSDPSTYDGLLGNICDCATQTDGASAGAPLCGDGTSAPATTQVKGKAYPTLREFSLVHDMGANGIIASLCPRTLDTTSADYGYNPAVDAIITKLKTQLGNTCIPQKLTPDSTGNVPCEVLELLPAGQSCDGYKLERPSTTLADHFREELGAESADAAASFEGRDVCEVPQLLDAGDCSTASQAGYCYTPVVDGGAQCQGRIYLSATGQVTGSIVKLECLESNSAAN